MFAFTCSDGEELFVRLYDVVELFVGVFASRVSEEEGRIVDEREPLVLLLLEIGEVLLESSGFLLDRLLSFGPVFLVFSQQLLCLGEEL